MGNILVTGFTGNVGQEVARKLAKKLEEKLANIQEAHDTRLICAVRNPHKAVQQYGESYTYTKLDFADPATYAAALSGIDRVFLLFPPGTKIQDFLAFVQAAAAQGVQHVTYLSVKDVSFMPFIPHYKNERAIRQSGIPYTFLRAGYFMQNLNMFLLDELRTNNRIYVAAGRGQTSFIDVRDIAEVAAMSLLHPTLHRNQKYTLTGDQALDFFEVAERMTLVLGKPITYANPTVKEFKTYMKAKGLEPAYVNVVAGLHLATKLGLAKGITPVYTRLTSLPPIRIETYLQDHRKMWEA